MSQNTQQIILKSSKMLAPTTRHLVFGVQEERPFSYTAGQFISLHIEKEQKIVRRNFSIANPPQPNGVLEIEFACSYVPNGLATTLLAGLQVGQSVEMSGPYGQLVLRPQETPKRYIFIATGTGVTPYRSMLPEIAQRLDSHLLDEVVLLFGVRCAEELLYGEEFRVFAKQYPQFHFIPCLSRVSSNELKMDERSGYVQTQLTQLNLVAGQDIIYLCGNPNMIDTIFNDLVLQGFERTMIRREKYISSPS